MLYSVRAMVKEDRKLVNFRFGVATLEALAMLVTAAGESQTSVVEAAILAAAARLGRENGETGLGLKGDAETVLRWWMRQDGMTEREVVEAAMVVYDGFRQQPQVSVAVEAAKKAPGGDDAPFHPTCAHCGAVFGAWNRAARMCGGCKQIGHYGDVRECPVCGEGLSI